MAAMMELPERSASTKSSVNHSYSAGQYALTNAARQDPATMLPDESYLRGVLASKLLARCGALLKRPPPGSQYTMSPEHADALYATSHEVGAIDWFISHSWKDAGWTKYMAIAWKLNFKVALAAANLMSALWVLAKSLVAPFPIFSFSKDPSPYLYTGQLVSLPYIVTFFVVLAQNKRHAGPKPDPIFFLDKSCIHQTDPVRKAQGIASIGGFLRESRRMLVLWSPGYFDRMWCNYELACFISLAGLKKVDVLPISMSVAAIGLLSCAAMKELIDFCSNLVQQVYRLSLPLWIPHLPLELVDLILLLSFARNLRQQSCLLQQLAEFTWDRSRCFCCDTYHKLPDTGETIPCDRLLVEANVNRWFKEIAAAGQTGLDAFEGYVREHLGRNVWNIQRRFVIPWTVWVAYSCMKFWIQVDYCIISPNFCKIYFLRAMIDTICIAIFLLAWQRIGRYRFYCTGVRNSSLIDGIFVLLLGFLSRALKAAAIFYIPHFVVNSVWGWSVLVSCVCLVVIFRRLYYRLF